MIFSNLMFGVPGGFVDDISEDFSAVIVCKKEQLRHGKFPIDKFTEWTERGQNQMLTSKEVRITRTVRLINSFPSSLILLFIPVHFNTHRREKWRLLVARVQTY